MAVAMQRERKPRGRGHERRDEIMGAAARMFAERGLANVSTRAIADAVGISQTTLYVYFPNKDAIYEALCEQCFMDLVARFTEVLSEVGTPTARLRRLMRAYVAFGLEHRDEYRLSFMTPHEGHAEKAAYLTTGEGEPPAGIRCFMLMQEQVARFCLEHSVRLDPLVAAQSLWASGHGLVALLTTMPSFPWQPAEDLIEATIDICIDGMLSQSNR